jgi:hypothetical protein
MLRQVSLRDEAEALAISSLDPRTLASLLGNIDAALSGNQPQMKADTGQ